MKTLSLFSLIALSYGTTLFAGTVFQKPETEYNTPEYDPCSPCNCEEGTCHPHHKPYCSGFFITADFLYWQANESQIDYADRVHTAPNQLAFDGKDFTVHPDFKPGFRVGAGGYFGENYKWELYANWTRFHTHGNSSQKVPNLLINPYTFTQFNSFLGAPVFSQTDFLIPNWWSGILGPRSLAASARWILHFDIWDLELGREIQIGNKFAIRPHAGARAARIHQRYNADYTSFWTSIDAVNIFATTNNVHFFIGDTAFRASNDFRGIGIEGGADIWWEFLPSFSLFAQFGGSLLYGEFKIHEKFQGFVNVQNLTTQLQLTPLETKIRKDIHEIVGNFETLLGFEWQYFFNCEKARFSLMAGYEMGIWFRQNQMFTINSGVDATTFPQGGGNIAARGDFILTETELTGNLTLQGLTVRASVDF
ncbi:MAG TPA: Lpg1974 family pore-forming outer membrane protein [Chlamydiales bacterium]|nr:Lpg1974 family pore-forming outer membrane protein [Chlamydiales bacterium]